MDKVLAAYPVTVPTMLVHSLWDQEDIYGAMAVWKALKGNDPAGNLHLVIGSWYHGQEITEASALGAIKWGQETGLWFIRKVLATFLAQYLHDASTKADTAPCAGLMPGDQPRMPACASRGDLDGWINQG